MRNAVWEKDTNTVRERKKGWEIEGGGINLSVGAGKPDRLTVTLNLSFRRKMEEFLKCAHLSTHIYHERCEAGLRGKLTRQIEGSHREREEMHREIQFGKERDKSRE